MINVLVLGAGGAAGINFCRALQRDGGFSIAATDTNADRLRLLDGIKHRFQVRRVDDPFHGEEVEHYIRMSGADVVYAQADSEVRWLMQNSATGKSLLPTLGALDAASDKLRLNKLLEDKGVPVPKSWHAVGDQARDDFEALKISTGKVWVRARCGAGSKAALPVSTYQQAQNWISYWSEFRKLDPSAFMMSEFLPGAEFAWQGLYKDGTLFASAVRQRLEYVFAEQMPSGQSSTPSLAMIVHNPDVNVAAERAVRAIDPTANGVYGVDCKSDATGTVRVTEINVGRFYTTSDFYAAAGANLPAAWCALARGLKGDAYGRDPIPAGLKWQRSLDRDPVLYA